MRKCTNFREKESISCVCPNKAPKLSLSGFVCARREWVCWGDRQEGAKKEERVGGRSSTGMEKRLKEKKS
jgi:hypothetical protein